MGKKIEPGSLKRQNPPQEPVETEEPSSVSAGPIDKVIELAFNPTREKIREVTIIDRLQGRLLPQLDIVGISWKYAIEIAMFRQDSVEYERVFKQKQPVSTDLIDEFMYRTAQWQKSVQGKNLDRAIDIALAETESKAGEDDDEYGSNKADDVFK